MISAESAKPNASRDYIGIVTSRRKPRRLHVLENFPPGVPIAGTIRPVSRPGLFGLFMGAAGATVRSRGPLRRQAVELGAPALLESGPSHRKLPPPRSGAAMPREGRERTRTRK